MAFLRIVFAKPRAIKCSVMLLVEILFSCYFPLNLASMAAIFNLTYMLLTLEELDFRLCQTI